MSNQNSKAKNKDYRMTEIMFLGKRQPSATFLSTHFINRMTDMVNSSFDPYGSFDHNYHVCFYTADCMDAEDITRTNQYFGSFTFNKKTNGDTSTYTVKRCITGFLNKKNTAKPESTTQYFQTVTHDKYLSVLQPGNSMGFEYDVNRRYYNDQTPGIYKNSQDIFIDNNKNIIKKNKNGDILIEKYSGLLFTQFSLIDTLQKFTVTEDPKTLNMDFDLLENMEVLKHSHNVRYFDTITVDFNGNNVPIVGYFHSGFGILPTYYWITEKGLLVKARYGVSSLILNA